MKTEINENKKNGVLIHSNFYMQNTLDWVGYKQQEFISHCSGSWKVQDQGFCFHSLLAVSSHSEK